MYAKPVDVPILYSGHSCNPCNRYLVLAMEKPWIPRRIPKSVTGPYLLYCSFAAWHFKGPRWLVAGVAFWGLFVSAMAVYDMLKARRLKEARDWPIAEGTVIHFDQKRDTDGI